MSASRQTVVLVHSPFLGPASLRPLADQLEVGGLPTLVPDLRIGMVSESVHQHLITKFADALGSSDGEESLVLVGHSGAGPLLPGFAEATRRPVAALVYLDAGLPTPGRSWSETAPAELVDELQSRSRGRRLPPWHHWFDPDPLADLVRDPGLRETLASEEPEMPIAFLAEKRPTADWTGPAGYLQLSAPYAAAAAQAAEQGWPVSQLKTHHLAPATEPTTVADALLPLLGACFAALPHL